MESSLELLRTWETDQTPIYLEKNYLLSSPHALSKFQLNVLDYMMNRIVYFDELHYFSKKKSKTNNLNSIFSVVELTINQCEQHEHCEVLELLISHQNNLNLINIE
jgi:hypothetical protein